MSRGSRVYVALEGELGARVRVHLFEAGMILADAPARADVTLVSVGSPAPGRCVAIGDDVAAGLAIADDVVAIARLDAELVPRVEAALRRGWSPSVARSLRLVAHDLNNPLGAARMLAELLIGDVAEPEQRQDAEDLLAAIDHAALLVETLTHAARAVDPATPWRAETLDLADAVRRVTRRPGLAGAALREPLASASVRVDGEHLAGALNELVLNGRRLGAGGERCEVSVLADPVRVEVRSARVNGAGWFPRVLSPDGAAAVREHDRVPVAALGLTVCGAFAARAGARVEVVEEAGATVTRLVWA